MWVGGYKNKNLKLITYYFGKCKIDKNKNLKLITYYFGKCKIENSWTVFFFELNTK